MTSACRLGPPILLSLGTVLGAGCYTGTRADSHGDGESTAASADSGDASSSGADGGDTDPGACASVAAGLAPMRRLTAVQYRNTILDLFGGTIEPSAAFPVTQTYKEYSNNPSLNVVSLPTAMDLLQAAEEVATAVIDDVDAVVSCDGTDDQACAEAFVDDFGGRAFRRPLRDDERAALLALYGEAAASDGFADGIGTVVAAVLQSPQFLYLVEEGTGELAPGIVSLSDHEIAARLSYLLWDTMPDATLREAADAGELQDPEGIQAQVERMLADDARATPALQRFVREWNHYDGVPTYDKDTAVYPQFTDALSASIDEELSRFVAGVLRSDEPTLAQLLTSTQTEVDAEVAALLGADAPAPGTWAPVSLGPERGGILTRPAILAEHSHRADTGPIFRGELVRTQLLCEAIPPPPPDAMANAPEYPEGATERERSEILMNHMNCGTCHALMNPIGLGFEDYDAIGTLRTVDIDGSAIDNSGEVVGGPEAVTGSFHGLAELQAELAASDEVTACFAHQLMQYSFGITDDQVDDCAIAPVAEAFVAADGDIRELVIALARSEAFRTRKLEP
ncbi:MAG: DUF1592 domain-containing protein [Nannocystaceae bacterium]|nr:DUF1592 domain-containing protein [Nannocystaceae bacterium]